MAPRQGGLSAPARAFVARAESLGSLLATLPATLVKVHPVHPVESAETQVTSATFLRLVRLGAQGTDEWPHAPASPRPSLLSVHGFI